MSTTFTARNQKVFSGNPQRVRIFAAIVVAFVMCSAVASAQQQAKVAKLGALRFGGRPDSARSSNSGFVLLDREFRALGYVEGKNIAFETRSAKGKLDRLPALANELVHLKVDVLIASSTNEVIAFKNATRTIPIVFTGVSDPVGSGLVDSLARPGGNITGISTIAALLAGKRLELLKETVPKLTRVAVLWNPQDAGSEQQWKESLHPARGLGLQLHSMEVSSADKYEGAFKDAMKARSTALAVTRDGLVTANQKQIADLATKFRLPAIYARGDFVESGGLMSYGPDQAEPYRRAARVNLS